MTYIVVFEVRKVKCDRKRKIVKLLSPGSGLVARRRFFCYNTAMNGRMRKGQSTLEYVLCLASLLVVVGILWGLVHVVLRHAERTENLVTADSP